jgi:hypothetical protein
MGCRLCSLYVQATEAGVVMRERKVIRYNFCPDFTSPRSCRVTPAKGSRVIGKDEQLTTARVLDEQLNKYRSM